MLSKHTLQIKSEQHEWFFFSSNGGGGGGVSEDIGAK